MSNVNISDLTASEQELVDTLEGYLSVDRDSIGGSGDSMMARMNEGWTGCDFEYECERVGSTWTVEYVFASGRTFKSTFELAPAPGA